MKSSEECKPSFGGATFGGSGQISSPGASILVRVLPLLIWCWSPIGVWPRNETERETAPVARMGVKITGTRILGDYESSIRFLEQKVYERKRKKTKRNAVIVSPHGELELILSPAD